MKAPRCAARRTTGRSASLTTATDPGKSSGSICEYSEVILIETLTRGRAPQAACSTAGSAGQAAVSRVRSSSRSR